ncbi:sensor histidine kinase [Eubacterium oxidoreducens]|uniref:histidine kinase n=1 Tax=Eubacterium oxidoreducens TaxID=1732 RepID=A0A1G6BWD4_EUBOX|nr:HAMP domain-containing sensor histidine kinase [Eubacterium oxidoreducens]SDB24919.1 His Kinase A (phospho-acceptor) domain-containing protein [Eubacterium oxidoreducens]
MKLKSRLITAFLFIIFVPLILVGVVFLGLNGIQMNELEKAYGVQGDTVFYLASSMQLLVQLTQAQEDELEQIALSEPKRLHNEEYLETMNQELEKDNSYLLIREDDELIFEGNDEDEKEPTNLDELSEKTELGCVGIFIDGGNQLMVRQINYLPASGRLSQVYIVTDIYDAIPQMQTMIIDLAVGALVVLFMTALILVVWIYQGILNPIKKLQYSAQKIKEGDFDYEISIERDDEIGEVLQTFEEMRQRLKINAEDKLRSERDNRELISNISHDLKTPITAIKGYMEGIMDGVADTPEKMDKYIRTVYNKANEMNILINELTLYLNIDTNRIPYNFNRIQVNDYFADCVEEVGMDLESKGINLSYVNEVASDVMIIADPEQLRRVVYNIVGNSIKYMDKTKEQGFVNIRVKDVGDFVQVEIEDNGKGIGGQDLPYVFDRFYRADSSRNSATGGSGIGLSIVRKIIEDHGGKIWATSTETVGTVMYFVVRKYQEVPNE